MICIVRSQICQMIPFLSGLLGETPQDRPHSDAPPRLQKDPRPRLLQLHRITSTITCPIANQPNQLASACAAPAMNSVPLLFDRTSELFSKGSALLIGFNHFYFLFFFPFSFITFFPFPSRNQPVSCFAQSTPSDCQQLESSATVDCQQPSRCTK